MKFLFYRVNKSDAKKLVSWWNANTKYYHFYKKRGGENLYNVLRQI